MFQVSEVSERTVLEQKAYILFYVRNTKPMAPQNTSPSPRTIKDSRAVVQVDSFLIEHGIQETHLFHSDKGETMGKDKLSSTVVDKVCDKEVSNNLEVMNKCTTPVKDDNSELKYVRTACKQQSKDGNECSKKEVSLSSDSDTTAPKLRHTFFQSASSYVLHILNVCEKFCFPSCFWPAEE